MLGSTDKTKYEEATATAAQRAAAVAKGEADVAAAKQRLELFQNALSELMIFKSRADVVLLQAQDQSVRLEREAEDTERRYSSAYAGGEEGGEEGFEWPLLSRESGVRYVQDLLNTACFCISMVYCPCGPVHLLPTC